MTDKIDIADLIVNEEIEKNRITHLYHFTECLVK